MFGAAFSPAHARRQPCPPWTQWSWAPGGAGWGCHKVLSGVGADATTATGVKAWIVPAAIGVGVIAAIAVVTGFASEKGRKLATNRRRRRR